MLKQQLISSSIYRSSRSLPSSPPVYSSQIREYSLLFSLSVSPFTISYLSSAARGHSKVIIDTDLLQNKALYQEVTVLERRIYSPRTPPISLYQSYSNLESILISDFLDLALVSSLRDSSFNIRYIISLVVVITKIKIRISLRISLRKLRPIFIYSSENIIYLGMELKLIKQLYSNIITVVIPVTTILFVLLIRQTNLSLVYRIAVPLVQNPLVALDTLENYIKTLSRPAYSVFSLKADITIKNQFRISISMRKTYLIFFRAQNTILIVSLYSYRYSVR